MNFLYYGDNLGVLREHIQDETVDLCYIDPPFHSQRNYNQIYTSIGALDSAQPQAFIDKWEWDEGASAGYGELVANEQGRFTSQTVQLLKGLHGVLGEGSLLAYLVSLTLRVTEIHRVLKKTGSFYLHCDPTASHYLKLIADAIFCSQGGDFKNEVVWKRTTTVKGNFGQGSKFFGPATDSLLFYTKSLDNTFHPLFKPYTRDYMDTAYRHVEPGTNRRYRLVSMIGPGGAAKGNPQYEVMGVTRYWRYSQEKMQDLIRAGLVVQSKPGAVPHRKYYLDEGKGVPIQSLWDDIGNLQASDGERLGYPTQKPQALLERLIQSSSNEGDLILDAYCGCGTTVDAAQKLKRRWIGVDITYQSIAVILDRLEGRYGKEFTGSIALHGIPQDMPSAVALAHKKDGRLRNEFEKWAMLTYTNSRAIIHEMKGADNGIDGFAYFKAGKKDTARIILQAKGGNAGREDIVTLRGAMEKVRAVMGVFITLDEPTGPMIQDAKSAGRYRHEETGRTYDRIRIVTVREIVEDRKRLEIPLSLRVLKAARRAVQEE